MIIMGSATPSLESYYNQICGKFTYHELLKRYGDAKYPKVIVVDMKKEQEERKGKKKRENLLNTEAKATIIKSPIHFQRNKYHGVRFRNGYLTNGIIIHNTF